ncbi:MULTISPECIES: CDP-alcohol phosphatidyltransferase family protein, partial [unclassified Methanoculleus]
MTLDQFRPQMQGIIQPMVNLAKKIGLTPNGLTVASFFVSILAGIAFYAGGVVLGIVMVVLNAVFDALDGALAR